MTETAGNRPPPAPSAGGPVRIEATPGHRRVATLVQCLLVGAIAVLAWVVMRGAAHVWPARDEPEIGQVLWAFIGLSALAGLTLAWLILLIQDLAKLTIEIGDDGVRVDRLLQPFRARWDEVREIGLVPARGHLTLKSTRGTLTTTEQLLGAAPYAALVAALRVRAGGAVREWSRWAATRRQLLLLVVPAVGLAFLVLIGQGIWRRRGRVGQPR